MLLLWIDGQNWAKLCLECSPASEPMVVSVVTRGVSDDANAFVAEIGFEVQSPTGGGCTVTFGHVVFT